MKSGAVTSEETLIIPARLPDGQDWAWHPDLNIVEVSDRLDDAGIMVALCDLQAQWRRSMVRLVPNTRPNRRSSGRSRPSFSFLRNDAVSTRPMPTLGAT